MDPNINYKLKKKICKALNLNNDEKEKKWLSARCLWLKKVCWMRIFESDGRVARVTELTCLWLFPRWEMIYVGLIFLGVWRPTADSEGNVGRRVRPPRVDQWEQHTWSTVPHLKKGSLYFRHAHVPEERMSPVIKSSDITGKELLSLITSSTSSPSKFGD